MSCSSSRFEQRNLERTVKYHAGHHWVVVSAFPVGRYCNMCKLATSHGAQCDFCGLVVDRACLKAAGKRYKCKQLSWMDADDDIDRMQHHWVNGNLPPAATCAVCEQICGDGPGIRDRRCCWCQRTVHTDCAANLGRVCDFGEFRRIIVPPNCVLLKKLGWKARRATVIDKIETEVAMATIKNWSPIIVIANRKSGNGDGERVLEAFRLVLNPVQVIDLAEVQPEVGLRWCHLLSGIAECRVLVAGGDGTVGWVLGAVEQLALNPKPHIALLPLGTGNDLSRALGWGSGHTSSDINVLEILRELRRSVPVKLDRWNVKITPRRRFGLRLPDKSFCMSNYLSVGVDAAVTLNFHNTRDTLPRAMSSRFINKMLFFTYGTQDVVERQCSGLTNCIQLSLDDKDVELPALEGIVVLNIPQWGAGVEPWPMRSTLYSAASVHQQMCSDPPPPQRIDDGLLEVFGLYSSFHIAQLQVGVGEPFRIGQAKSVTLRVFHRAVPMQCDGEPWQQPPAVIKITHLTQALLLASPEHASTAAHITSSPELSPTSDTGSGPKFF